MNVQTPANAPAARVLKNSHLNHAQVTGWDLREIGALTLGKALADGIEDGDVFRVDSYNTIGDGTATFVLRQVGEAASPDDTLSDAAFLDECAMRAMQSLLADALEFDDAALANTARLAERMANAQLAERKRRQTTNEKRLAMDEIAPPPSPIDFDANDWGGHSAKASTDGRMFTINGVPHTLYDVSGEGSTGDGRPLLTMKFRREEK